MPSIFDNSVTEFDFRDEGTSVGFHHVEGEAFLGASVDEVKEFTEFGAVGDDVITFVLGVETSFAHRRVGNDTAEIRDLY